MKERDIIRQSLHHTYTSALCDYHYLHLSLFKTYIIMPYEILVPKLCQSRFDALLMRDIKSLSIFTSVNMHEV